jgi:hypothetical protein
MGLAALMLIGAYSSGGLEAASGLWVHYMPNHGSFICSNMRPFCCDVRQVASIYITSDALYVNLRQLTIDLHQFTSINNKMCIILHQFMCIYERKAKMMNQMCKNRRTDKEIPIHNVVGRPPTFVEAAEGRPIMDGYFCICPSVLHILLIILAMF